MFIDAFFSPEDPLEKAEYDRNVELLWNFSAKATPFECKDIKAALNDLMEARQNITLLKDELLQKEEEIKGKSRLFQ